MDKKLKALLDELDSVLEIKAERVTSLVDVAVHGYVTHAIQLEHQATMKLREIIGTIAAQLSKAK